MVADGITCTQKLHLDNHGQSVLWSPDHTRLLSITSTSQPQIIDANTGKVLSTYVPTIRAQGSGGNGYMSPFDSVWSPDGTHIISSIATQPWSIQVWSASTGQVVSTPLTQSNSSMWFMSLSPRGTYVAITTDKDLENWNIATKTLISHLPVGINEWRVWSHDETRLAIRTADHNHVNIWSVSDGKQIASIADTNIGTLALSPDGKYLAESNTMIHLWDIQTKKVVATFGDNQLVANLAWSLDGSKLASSVCKQGDLTKSTVSIWKLS